MTTKQRICKFIVYKNMNVARFQKSIGVSQSYISNMTKGIGPDVLKRIADTYPELNIEWLNHGEGNMLNESAAQGTPNMVCIMPVSAIGGKLIDYTNPNLPGCETILSPSEHTDVAIRITDDSMEPLYHKGSVALLQHSNAEAFLAWGSVYVIDTINGIYVRRVFQSEEHKDNVTLVSCNSNYPKFDVKKSHIHDFYKILATINIY